MDLRVCLHQLRSDYGTDQSIRGGNGMNERRKDITPCEDYELDGIWLVVDWLYI